MIYITLPFIQLVYFISSEKKLTIHIVQMFQCRCFTCYHRYSIISKSF
ncbi:DUF5445 family protein [Escherichia coli]|nr:hypothetical protein [Escherichia coli]EHH7533286.1 hypothetical protein [Escherichia coli]EHN3636893.1 DUF5445 family protein [Escherichia coli]EIZ3785060.1 DUF5445 family protein [Escherichia coli]EIZ3825188.1 DUF5445 family protein [Escherichia coli]